MESQTKLVSSGADPMVLELARSALADCLLSTDCWPRPAHNLAMTKKYQHDPPCNAMQSYTRGKTFFKKSQKEKKCPFLIWTLTFQDALSLSSCSLDWPQQFRHLLLSPFREKPLVETESDIIMFCPIKPITQTFYKRSRCMQYSIGA